MSPTTATSRLAYGSDTYDRVVDFLYTEAELLDERRHDEWLELLAPEIRYVMPVRVTTAHSLEGSTLAGMAHFDEDLYSLRKRVARFNTEHAWAEDPPSRTRRHLSNVRCWQGERGDEVIAKSNLLLFRSRGDLYEHDLLSAMRTDVVRLENDTSRLVRRDILVDESVLRTQNLAVFL